MRSKKGQGLVEYLILVCLIAVTAIAVVRRVGTNIKEQYANISNSLQNGKSIKLTAPDASSYRERNLDDYMQGSSKGK